ncbi:hypothetical protein BJ912DRAFT_495421 [Pholiota molesta]|nr:hypothetical protein BJ912DRAFT_495421 [Pholiota molesta]
MQTPGGCGVQGRCGRVVLWASCACHAHGNWVWVVNCGLWVLGIRGSEARGCAVGTYEFPRESDGLKGARQPALPSARCRASAQGKERTEKKGGFPGPQAHKDSACMPTQRFRISSSRVCSPMYSGQRREEEERWFGRAYMRVGVTAAALGIAADQGKKGGFPDPHAHKDACTLTCRSRISSSRVCSPMLD